MRGPWSVLAEYLRRDWYIFPIQGGGKVPLTRNGWKDATLDPEQVQRWMKRFGACNWGIATGPSHLLVVDLDGRAGEQAWLDLTNVRERHVPGTLTSMTGGGGWHLLFHDPDGRGRNSTRLLGPGIDTRGKGGYIVAPPSLHPSGRRYGWVGEEGELRRPLEAPNWLLARLRQNTDEPRQAPRMAISGHGDTPYGARVMEGILRRLAAAEDGNRHDLNYWAGVRAGQLHIAGHVGPDALGRVIDTATQARKDHIAMRRDTLDGWRWGIANPGTYPVATVDASVPRARAPRAYIPRAEVPQIEAGA